MRLVMKPTLAIPRVDNGFNVCELFERFLLLGISIALSIRRVSHYHWR